jgi:VanZ family protein
MNGKRERRLPATLALLATAAVMAGLYAVSSIPGEPQADPTLVDQAFSWFSPTVHNLLHVPSYALLAWTLFHALPPRLPARIAFLLVVAIAGGYGAALELHQAGIPGRYASLTDVALNCTGAVLGFALAARFAARRARRPAGHAAG